LVPFARPADAPHARAPVQHTYRPGGREKIPSQDRQTPSQAHGPAAVHQRGSCSRSRCARPCPTESPAAGACTCGRLGLRWRPSFAVVHVGAPHLASGALMGLLFQRLPEPRIRAAAVDAGMGPIWRSERRSGAHTPRPAPHGHTPSTPTNATQFQRAAYRHEAPPAGTSKPT
jgi:hypothetical protein